MTPTIPNYIITRSQSKLKPGSIVFVRRGWIFNIASKVCFGSKWSHVLLYLGNDTTCEMTYKGIRKMTFSKRYGNVPWVGIDIIINREDRKEFLHLLNLFNLFAKFDWIRYFYQWFPRRANHFLCHEYIEEAFSRLLDMRINLIRMGNCFYG